MYKYTIKPITKFWFYNEARGFNTLLLGDFGCLNPFGIWIYAMNRADKIPSCWAGPLWVFKFPRNLRVCNEPNGFDTLLLGRSGVQ